MSDQSPTEHDDTRLLQHLMVVGFHHKKGCLVEYCYPPLDPSVFASESSPSPDELSRSSTSPIPSAQNEPDNRLLSKIVESTLEPVKLPSIWQTLPSLAIPDGSHNQESDTVFFNLPHLQDWTKAVYCIGCYRQIATKDLLVRTPDMTRSSVQKSVVALLRIPAYGIVEYKLEIVTRAYFNELDFTKTNVLRESFHNINRQLNPSIIDSPELLTGLSVRSLFTRFGTQVITLFKLMLLEKKTIFIMSPIRELSSSILTLCSLIPGLVQEGLVNSVIPFNVKTDGENLILNRNQSKGNLESMAQIAKETITSRSTNSNAKSCDTDADFTKVKDSKSTDLTCQTVSPKAKHPTDSTNTFTPSPDAASQMVKSESQSSFSSALTDTVDNVMVDPQLPEESEEEAQKRLATIFSRPHLYYGLPLQIFAHSSYLLPYFSISYFDVLVHERVRSCIAGSSNQIFKRWENDIDVFVLDNQVEIDDAQLKRILRPTVEDMNFMGFLIKSIMDNANPLGTADIFDQSQHIFYDGSDEWIRCHFKNYLLHMMRCSFLEETSREYRAFNPLFMAAWKETHNYKAWSSGPYTAACHRDIDPAHPFSGNRLSNFKFKIANLLFNRQEYINQSLNKQAISNAISNARSTVNSWLTNLGSSINQAKAATSGWNAYIGAAVAGPSRGTVNPTRNGSNRQANNSNKKDTEKDSFVHCPASGGDEPDEDETSV